MSLTLEESIAIERNPVASEEDLAKLSNMGKGRREMFSGAWFEPSTMVVGSGLASIGLSNLRTLGYEFDERKSDDGKRSQFKIKNRWHVPTPEQFAAVRETREQSREAKAKSTEKATSFPCTHDGCDFVSTTPQGLGRHRVAVHATKKRTYKKRVVTPVPELPDPVDLAPRLGSDLRVFLLHHNDDGTVSIGLRNGTRSFMARLEEVTST